MLTYFPFTDFKYFFNSVAWLYLKYFQSLYNYLDALRNFKYRKLYRHLINIKSVISLDSLINFKYRLLYSQLFRARLDIFLPPVQGSRQESTNNEQRALAEQGTTKIIERNILAHTIAYAMKHDSILTWQLFDRQIGIRRHDLLSK